MSWPRHAGATTCVRSRDEHGRDGHGRAPDRGWNVDPEFITIKSNLLGSADGSTAK
jgi:hypothetical protein